jgi:O-antigen ligase
MKKKILSLLLFLYLVSLFIFDNERDLIFVYVSNILMLAWYFIFYFRRSRFYFYDNPLIKYFGVFVFINIISIIWSIDIFVAFSRSLTLIQVFINSVVIFNILKITNTKDSLPLAFFVCSLYHFLILIEVFEIQSHHYLYNRFLGTTTNSNILAIYMFFSVFGSLYFLLKDKLNIIYKIFLFLNITTSLFVITFTQSKKGIIFSFLIITISLLHFIKPNRGFFKRIFKLSFAILAIVFLYPLFFDLEILTQNFDNIFKRLEQLTFLIDSQAATDGSTEDRLEFTNLALNTFYSNPFLGVGSNNFSVLYPRSGYSHNNFVEILANLGIVGFIPFYMLYYFTKRKLDKISVKKIKILLMGFTALLLIMEIALVTYYSKYLIIILFWLFLTAETYNNRNVE